MVLICANDPPAEAGFLFFAFSKVYACVADIKCRRDSTPLCPAGHLPLKGGDWLLHRFANRLPLQEERGE
ncbi:hypothetical protein [Mesorhizobium onobrychidis]|uniref:Lytic murein transglycosylase n=1 Tax=Mesorhizobium onobrychidis TaxID=2775404 RepID=A0ABY5R4M2_9HYPH|nr:hypothetical protein [Mesorhizobium onobrychidis]UVC18420.1 hypothetical protein IHQ72_15900 [Mesorhizobium onobrychidis]